MKATYIDSMGTDLTVVQSARVSMGKQSDWKWCGWGGSACGDECEDGEVRCPDLHDKDKKLISYLAKHQHYTPFEHCTVTLHLKVPLFVCAQIQRHRTFAFNQISRRYVKDNLEFYYPEKWRAAADTVKQGSSEEEVTSMIMRNNVESWNIEPGDAFQLAIEGCEACYNSMLAAGICAEQARSVLPQALYTEFYMTGSLRAWAAFLKLRLDSHTQKECRDIAEQCAALIKPLFPVSYAALMENNSG